MIGPKSRPIPAGTRTSTAPRAPRAPRRGSCAPWLLALLLGAPVTALAEEPAADAPAAPAPADPAAPADAPGPAAPAPAAPTLSPQEAATAIAEARAHYMRGEKAYLASDYATARAEFAEAYRLSPRPPLLYNLARAALRQGNQTAAASYLQDYLRTDPADAEEVRKELERISTEPPPAPIVTPPPPPPPPLPEVKPQAPRWPDGVMLGLGAAALISGAAILGAGAGTTPALDDAEGQARARTLSTSGTYLLIGGGVMAAAGGILLGVHSRRPAPRIAVLPAGLGLQVLGRF